MENVATKTAADADIRQLARILTGELSTTARTSSATRAVAFPRTSIAVLLPAKAGESADGAIVTLEANPLHIEEFPVKRVTRLPQIEREVWLNHFAETAELMRALAKGNQSAIKRIADRIGESSLALDNPDNLMRYAAASLMNGLRKISGGSGAQLVLWIDAIERGVKAGLLCKDERVAAFALLLHDAEFKFRACGRRGCEKTFAVDRWHPREFCSTRCKNAEIVARFRARQKRSAKRRRSKAR